MNTKSQKCLFAAVIAVSSVNTALAEPIFEVAQVSLSTPTNYFPTMSGQQHFYVAFRNSQGPNPVNVAVLTNFGVSIGTTTVNTLGYVETTPNSGFLAVQPGIGGGSSAEQPFTMTYPGSTIGKFSQLSPTAPGEFVPGLGMQYASIVVANNFDGGGAFQYRYDFAYLAMKSISNAPGALSSTFVGFGYDPTTAAITGSGNGVVAISNAINYGPSGIPASGTIRMNGKTLTLDPVQPDTFTGTLANGTATAGNSFVINSGVFTLTADQGAGFTGSITANSAATLNLGGNLSATVPLIASGTVQLVSNGSAQRSLAGGVTVNAGGKLLLTAPGSSTTSVTTSSLAIAGTVAAPTGQVDIGKVGFVIDYSGSVGNKLTDTLARVKAGRGTTSASGVFAYDGQGITSSSVAADNAAAGFNKYAIGAINNADLTTFGLDAYTAFGGATVDGDSILIRYTYAGDANLDGLIDAADYSLLNQGFSGAIANVGWLSGDFTGDGLINADDYAVIDFGYLKQSGVLGLGSPVVVPEPALLGVAGFAAAFMLRRRRVSFLARA